MKNRTYSLINIIGLSIGLAASLCVITVLIDESSFDKDWTKADQIFRLNTITTRDGEFVEKGDYALSGMQTALAGFPEVDAVSPVNLYETNFNFEGVQGSGINTQVLSANPDFLDIFNIQITSGNPANLTSGMTNIVISESFSKKFFTEMDPVGKIIEDFSAYGEKPGEYLITGIFKDLPANSHLKANILSLREASATPLNKNQFGMFQTFYLTLKKGTNKASFESKFNKWYANYVEVDHPDKFELQGIKDIYLHSEFATNQTFKGSAEKLYILGGIAILLLVIACINYINLTTARAAHKLQENGIRKILGAKRFQLVSQYLAESTLFFFISGVLAFIIYALSLAGIESYIGHSLVLTFTANPLLFLSALLGIIALSIVTGLYPAMLISGIKPTASLHKKFLNNAASNGHPIRKVLVIFQFSISLIVLIAMIIVNQQVELLKTKDIGFNPQDLISTNYATWDGKGETFKNELLSNPYVENVSISSWVPSNGGGNMHRKIEDPLNPNKEIQVWYLFGDSDLARTLGLELHKGRFLNKNFSYDAADSSFSNISDSTGTSKSMRSALITAQTSELLQIKQLDKINKSLETTPVGIINNFNNEDLRTEAKPVVIQADKNPDRGAMLIKIKPSSEPKVIAEINKLWQKFYPYKLLELNNVSEQLQKQYLAETKLLQFFSFFGALTLFLAALGVFGLIVQITEQRVKEIGIRKVLGASVNSIIILFSTDFLKIVIIAILIASPIAWYAMSLWLQNYAYRVEMQWWYFALASVIVTGIALLTVGTQSARKSYANPADNLRTE
ncbi:ABC transporter permease [Christiangramia sediminis]|uniref:ABC transporter permease n=1 Tax=Christiangramia sediminis TaxID=2881336 RepID=A0A9X1LHS0_9FLAO|nr:ABC transporter permease [Christiangramia sediminis]MCB7480533.1 ABC transporter permease [Christiangramia sediminis]